MNVLAWIFAALVLLFAVVSVLGIRSLVKQETDDEENDLF